MLVLSAGQSDKEHTIYIKCYSFPEIQSLFIQLCNLQKDRLVLPELNVNVKESGVMWLCYLYDIPLEKQEIKDKVKDRNLLQELLKKTFGLSMSVFEDISSTPNPLSLSVVQLSGLLPLQSYLQLREGEDEEKGYSLHQSSFSMIVTKLKEIYDTNTFHRLVQISMIRYPSPDPVIRTVLKKYNEDWVVLFDKDPSAFYQVLQQSTQPIYRCLSSRSYKNKEF